MLIAYSCTNNRFIGKKSKKRKSLDWDDDEDKELLLQREAMRTIKLDQVNITPTIASYNSYD